MRPVVAWDGEAIETGPGEQRYAYLAASSGEEWNELTRKRRMTTEAALDMLTLVGSRQPKGTLNVWYGGGYDVNMILGDLSWAHLRELWVGGSVRWRGYRISYVPKRQFRVKVRNRAITIWDAVGFSQAPFEEAMRLWGVDDDPIISEGKARRGLFTRDDLRTFVPRYTFAELRALVAIERRMLEMVDVLGLQLTRHDGAGSLASAIFRAHGGKGLIPTEFPASVEAAAAHAYFGGRIELLQYGTSGLVHHYDVRSAYPAAMASLPDMREGSWSFEAMPGSLPSPWSMTLVEWRSDGSSPAYPFAYREAGGYIKFPPSGRAWVWGPELLAALEHPMPGMCFEQLERWTWRGPESRPFAWVAELYRERGRLKRAGKHEQLILKLGLNSLYGKLAQLQGWNGNRPPYYCLPYAGLITSITRARLWRAAAQAPEAILFFATDGIFSSAPLDLKVGPDLGRWEAATHDRSVLVQPGVYFYQDGEGMTSHYRGWGKGALDAEAIRASWLLGEDMQERTLRRFVGMGAALSRVDRSVWRSWQEQPRRLELHPCAPNGKRRPERGPAVPRGKRSPARTLLPTLARGVELGVLSRPRLSAWEQLPDPDSDPEGLHV